MSRSKHRRAVRNLANHPEIIDIDPRRVREVEIEKELKRGNRLVAEPDVVFTLEDGTIILIEYKSNGSGRELRRAEEQLRIAKEWYRRQGIECQAKIVSGSEYPELKKSYIKGSSEGRDKATVRRAPGYSPSY